MRSVLSWRIRKLDFTADFNEAVDAKMKNAPLGMLRIPAELALQTARLIFSDDKTTVRHKHFENNRQTLSQDGKIFCDAGNDVYEELLSDIIDEADEQRIHNWKGIKRGDIIEHCLCQFRRAEAQNTRAKTKLSLLETMCILIMCEKDGKTKRWKYAKTAGRDTQTQQIKCLSVSKVVHKSDQQLPCEVGAGIPAHTEAESGKRPSTHASSSMRPVPAVSDEPKRPSRAEEVSDQQPMVAPSGQDQTDKACGDRGWVDHKRKRGTDNHVEYALTQMHKAAATNDISVVIKEMEKRGAQRVMRTLTPLDFGDRKGCPKGKTVVQLAAFKKLFPIDGKLTEDEIKHYYRSLCKLGHLSQVLDWKDDRGSTALHLAVASGNLLMVECLLEEGAGVISSPNVCIQKTSICSERTCRSSIVNWQKHQVCVRSGKISLCLGFSFKWQQAIPQVTQICVSCCMKLCAALVRING